MKRALWLLAALVFTGAATFGSIQYSDPNVAWKNAVGSWTAAQRGSFSTPTISTATFTPSFDVAQNFKIGLTSACPCTLANPSTTLIAGQTGVIEFAQDGTGSRTVGTWGSAYAYAGGTSTITLSTAAYSVDFVPYVVNDAATKIVLAAPLLNPVH